MSNTLNLTDWITIKEAMKQTVYSGRHIRLLAQSGKITAHRVGERTWLIHWPSLRDYEPETKRWPAGKPRK